MHCPTQRNKMCSEFKSQCWGLFKVAINSPLSPLVREKTLYSQIGKKRERKKKLEVWRSKGWVLVYKDRKRFLVIPTPIKKKIPYFNRNRFISNWSFQSKYKFWGLLSPTSQVSQNSKKQEKEWQVKISISLFLEKILVCPNGKWKM